MRTPMVTIATMAVLVPAAPADARDGCNTDSCERRVKVRHMREIVRPYRGWLDRLGGCETRGMSLPQAYRANTGNGAYGRYQFTLSTWWAAGGFGLPHRASPTRQDYVAVRWRWRIGEPRQSAGWPVCG